MSNMSAGFADAEDGGNAADLRKNETDGMTFPRFLDRAAADFSQKEAFRYTVCDYSRTYAQFRAEVDLFARGLVSLGIGAGSRVALWMTNLPEWFVAFWATVRIGAVAVTVNTAYRTREIEYVLRQSDADMLIMIRAGKDTDYDQSMQELCPEAAVLTPGEAMQSARLPRLRHIVTVGFRRAGSFDFEQVKERAGAVPPEVTEQMAAQIKPDDVCCLQYTSGTTGRAKGAMLTHRGILRNGTDGGARLGLSSSDRVLIQVPMFHSIGISACMVAGMAFGATLCPLPYFSARLALDGIAKEKITCLSGVPTMFLALMQHPDYRRTDFSHLRTGLMGGADCPPALMEKVARKDEMNLRQIVVAYGQTEASPLITMSCHNDPFGMRTGTVGHPMPDVECKIVDPADGKELPDGQTGEICVRGYNTMKGYYKMEAETQAAIDADGWLHTGDLACRDENGCYTVIGRIKDMVIRGGENIYPKEIEYFLLRHQKIRDAQVVGIPDKTYGEEVVAFVILMNGESATEEEIRDYIGGNLARYKIPKYVCFTDGFPMNSAGKVQKFLLREQAIRLFGEP